jgi:RNA polymerase sigma factor for flagellar operon FliA
MSDHTEANALAIDHMKLVQKIAYRLTTVLPLAIEQDDLEGAGYIGLVQASRSFDPSKGVPFSAYARRRIRGAILDWLRKNDWLPRGEREKIDARGEEAPCMVSLEKKLSRYGHAGKIICGRHILTAKQRPPEHSTDVDDFWATPRVWASPREWRVLQMYYRDGMNHKQIGAILGVCASRVCHMLQAVRVKAAS